MPLGLSRKRYESVVIETAEGLITITITSIHSTPVKLGITAPKSIPVWRKEIYEQRQLGYTRKEVQ